MIKIPLRTLVLAFVVSTATPGFSSTIAYFQSAQATGNQNWLGSLGMDFHVDQAIVVTEIGVFSNNAFGNLNAAPATALYAGIFQLSSDFGSTTGTLITGSSVSFATTGSYTVTDNWLFQPISIALAPGYYSIVAKGYNGLEQDGNNGVGGPPPLSSENPGGLITFGGNSRFEPNTATPPSVLAFPVQVDGGPSNRYYAGNFRFDAAAPEPASMLLIGIGLVGIALRSRRHRQR